MKTLKKLLTLLTLAATAAVGQAQTSNYWTVFQAYYPGNCPGYYYLSTPPTSMLGVQVGGGTMISPNTSVSSYGELNSGPTLAFDESWSYNAWRNGVSVGPVVNYSGGYLVTNMTGVFEGQAITGMLPARSTISNYTASVTAAAVTFPYTNNWPTAQSTGNVPGGYGSTSGEAPYLNNDNIVLPVGSYYGYPPADLEGIGFYVGSGTNHWRMLQSDLYDDSYVAYGTNGVGGSGFANTTNGTTWYYTAVNYASSPALTIASQMANASGGVLTNQLLLGSAYQLAVDGQAWLAYYQSVTLGAVGPTNPVVTVNGPGYWTYQWRLNGANLAGQTNATINFAQFGAPNVGLYTVVVSNQWVGITNQGVYLYTQAAGVGASEHLSSVVQSGQLTLIWPDTGWRLVCQTNAPGKGVNLATNAWYTVTTTSNGLTVPVNPTAGSVFYRLVNP